jgi:multidrug efflux pump subunit AcrA (membrane-fusion protein)
VTLGARLGDMMEILSGLKAGDRAVLKPPKSLKNGMKIKINEK